MTRRFVLAMTAAGAIGLGSGHAGAADNEQRAHLQALEFSYLWQQLGRNG